MSKVISLLQRLGEDAALRHADRATLERALLEMELDPELRAALLDADPQRLAALLGAPAKVVCAIFPGKTPDDDEDDKDDEPDEDDDKKDGATRHLRRTG